MSDGTIATIARHLAVALRRRAHDRDEASIKEVARLHTELCQAVNLEEEQQADAEEEGRDVP